ncbi:hypothetical protein YC2023_058900 [Brassica napus]
MMWKNAAILLDEFPVRRGYPQRALYLAFSIIFAYRLVSPMVISKKVNWNEMAILVHSYGE